MEDIVKLSIEDIKEIVKDSKQNKISYFMYPGLPIHAVLTADMVVRQICLTLDVDYWKVMGRNKKVDIVETRFICWYFLYNTKIVKTKSAISKIFERHHATVIHGLNQISIWIEADDKVKEKYKKVMSKFLRYYQNYP